MDTKFGLIIFTNISFFLILWCFVSVAEKASMPIEFGSACEKCHVDSSAVEI